jgi:long-subunit fatty acid transport protein
MLKNVLSGKARGKISYYLILICLLLGSVDPLFSQDTHYNSNQFGARSALLGGAIIGDVNDNTGVFYNPAGLGFMDTATLSINGNAYQIENIKIENALGQKKDFKSSHLGSVPLFVGGMLRKGEKRLKIGFTVMSSVNFQFKATARIDDTEDIAGDLESPGKEEFIGQSSVNTKVSELLFGLGGGYKLNDNWSVGLSNLFTVRSVSYNRTTIARFFLNQPDFPLVSSSFSRNADYFNVRYAAKIGLNYRKNRFSAGLTVTSPSLNLFGTGTVAVDIIGNNILYEGSRTDILANDRQEKLKSKFKSPLAAGLGANYTFGRSQIGVALNYHGSTKIYDILRANPSDFIRPVSLNAQLGSADFLRVKTGAKQVFNFAVGYEYALKPNMTLSGSIRTDNSYFDKNLDTTLGIRPDVTTWNIYHIAMGTTFTRGRSKMSIGLVYSTGKDDRKKSDGNLENPSENNLLQGSTTITKAKYNSIGFILGYAFVFKKF